MQKPIAQERCQLHERLSLCHVFAFERLSTLRNFLSFRQNNFLMEILLGRQAKKSHQQFVWEEKVQRLFLPLPPKVHRQPELLKHNQSSNYATNSSSPWTFPRPKDFATKTISFKQKKKKTKSLKESAVKTPRRESLPFHYANNILRFYL